MSKRKKKVAEVKVFRNSCKSSASNSSNYTGKVNPSPTKQNERLTRTHIFNV